MKVAELHERLRENLRQEIRNHNLDISKLSRQTGMGRSHLSNFLAGKRGLSRDAMDRIMAAQGIETEHFLRYPHKHDLLAENERVSIPIVSHEAALSHPNIFQSDIQAYMPLPADALKRLSGRTAGRRLAWRRFVAVRISAAEAKPMEPIIVPDALVVIDRHRNTVRPYRDAALSIYVVRRGTHLQLRYAEIFAGQIALRCRRQVPLEELDMASNEKLRDPIAGRIVYVLNPM